MARSEQDETEAGVEARLKKASDFDQQLKRDLGLPDLEEILKDLQRRHGVRISFSPNLVKRLEAAKKSSADATTLGIGCHETDICVFCDQNDYCPTCDSMDWCITVDTHIA